MEKNRVNQSHHNLYKGELTVLVTSPIFQYDENQNKKIKTPKKNQLILENNENVIRHHLHTNLQNYIIFKECTGFKTTSISSSDGQKIQKTIPDEVNKNH